LRYRDTEQLRVLIANERKDRLALVAPIVAALGHEVIARKIEVEDVGAVTARERPDVALVGLGASSDHAPGLIERIVRESACPVIALLHAPDADFVTEASKRGVFAYITDADTEDWQSSSAPVRRVPRSRRRVRAARHNRAGQGHPDGTPLLQSSDRLLKPLLSSDVEHLAPPRRAKHSDSGTARPPRSPVPGPSVPGGRRGRGAV